MSIYLLNCMVEMIEGDSQPFPADAIAEAKEQVAEVRKLFLPNLNASKLAALNENAQQNYLTALESAGKPQQTPRRNDFGGPSP